MAASLFVLFALLATVVKAAADEDAMSSLCPESGARTTTSVLLQKQIQQSTGTDHSKLLAAIVYWTPQEMTESQAKYQKLRLEALRRTLKEIHSFSAEADIILVTNVHVEEAASYVWKEVLRPSPMCTVEGKQDNLCLPWEALRLLRDTALTGKVPENVTAGLDRSVTDWLPHLRTYDYFMYGEEDMLMSHESFEFWKTHADDAFDRGYYLMPHRRELRNGRWMLTDYFKVGPGNRCYTHTQGIVDTTSSHAGEYDSFEDSVYLLPGCPYAAMFLLTKREFADWLRLKMWDFEHVEATVSWPIRERATMGLMTFTYVDGYQFGVAPGSRTPLTHMKLGVEHQMPSMEEFAEEENADLVRVPVSELSNAVSSCEVNGKKAPECHAF